jgi:hypothetical protein
MEKCDLASLALVLLGEIVRAGNSHPANLHSAEGRSALGC